MPVVDTSAHRCAGELAILQAASMHCRSFWQNQRGWRLNQSRSLTMLLRRCTSLLLLGVSISFTLNLYRIWHTDHLSISSVLPPLLLFAIPLTLIATYCLCFPHRPWRGRTAPFATFVGA